MNTRFGLSIVIPTLNEEHFIQNTLDTLLICVSDHSLLDIIIIDAGSTDNTTKLVSAYSQCAVICQPEFKGKKYLSLNYGASQAKHDTLLFLDADSKLPEHFDRHIKDAIGNGYVGGAFHMRHDKRNFLLRVVEWGNTIRYSLSYWFFGDQAVFCTKEAFAEVQGYPARDIMESAFFCKSLKRIGRLKLIDKYVIASSRRFYQHGILRTFMFDLVIWIKCILNISTVRESKKYWLG